MNSVPSTRRCVHSNCATPLSKAASICSTLVTSLSGASAWPDRPIKFVVPYPPAALTDLLAGRVQMLSVGIQPVQAHLKSGALRALAAQAVTKGTGARALRSMLERIMLDIMYDVPSREDIAEVTINRAVVEGKKLPLIRKKQDKTAA